MHTRTRACRAFTLIELLTVAAIIGILTAMSMPAVSAMSKSNDRAQAVNQVRAMLSHARGLALSQNRQVGVVFFRETSKHALPAHGNQIALQIFVEEYDQTTTPAKNPRNTLFQPASPAREYLPVGIGVAALNDQVTKGVINGDSSGGNTLAILFDAGGRMITRHGVARRDLSGPYTPGQYPYAIADWHFATQGTDNPKSDNSSDGISSPGLFLYDNEAYRAATLKPGADGDAARNQWVKAHSTVIVINANTGAPLP
jgi:prepilin-type N-terminal cleavage/methylation domain-containing protein